MYHIIIFKNAAGCVISHMDVSLEATVSQIQSTHNVDSVKVVCENASRCECVHASVCASVYARVRRSVWNVSKAYRMVSSLWSSHQSTVGLPV